MQNPQCNGPVHTHIHSFAGKYFRPIFDLGFSVCIVLGCSLGMNIFDSKPQVLQPCEKGVGVVLIGYEHT